MKYLKKGISVFMFLCLVGFSTVALTHYDWPWVYPANLPLVMGPDQQEGTRVVFSQRIGEARFFPVISHNKDIRTASPSTILYTDIKPQDKALQGRKLIWSDEFNTDGVPDSSKWGFDIGTGWEGWGNAELEYYTDRPQNAFVKNGVLRVTSIKENYKGCAYTSARLLSKDKFSFTYGRVEVRAKVPVSKGTWAAIWMMGSNIATTPWPDCGEIDIMEHRGSEKNKIFGTLHYPGRSGENADGNTKIIPGATNDFHIYSMDWSAGSVNIFVDGILLHSVVNSGKIPFNHDFFLLLNVAMGGYFGGKVDPAFSRESMEVDYIRVYQ